MSRTKNASVLLPCGLGLLLASTACAPSRTAAVDGAYGEAECQRSAPIPPGIPVERPF